MIVHRARTLITLGLPARRARHGPQQPPHHPPCAPDHDLVFVLSHAAFHYARRPTAPSPGRGTKSAPPYSLQYIGPSYPLGSGEWLQCPTSLRLQSVQYLRCPAIFVSCFSHHHRRPADHPRSASAAHTYVTLLFYSPHKRLVNTSTCLDDLTFFCLSACIRLSVYYYHS